MSLGHDPELPAGFQDADLEQAELERAAEERPVSVLRLVIEIELGNEAMRLRADAFDAIRRALLEIDRPEGPRIYEPLEEGERKPVHDQNGNTVGEWRVERSLR